MPDGSYEDWLQRERMIRMRILGQSPEIARSGLHRVCADCGEALLCHEDQCPNCGGRDLAQARLGADEVAGRMRLAKRWRSLREAGS